MAKEKSVGESIIESLQEVADYKAGKIPLDSRTHEFPDPEVREIRTRMGLTQRELAAEYGLPLASIRDWEQGRCKPTGAARTLLFCLQYEPRAVARALKKAAPVLMDEGCYYVDGTPAKAPPRAKAPRGRPKKTATA